MNTATLPDVLETSEIAVRMLSAVQQDPEYGRLVEGCGRYNSDWTCTTGTLTVDEWDITTDAPRLIDEAFKALALKSAVYALTEDEDVAEIAVARPVDEVLHAILAQRTVTERLAERCGIQIVHMTDTEVEGAAYEIGDYTHECYTLAWGEPPARYWIGAAEHARRVEEIEVRLASVGFLDVGRRHNITFSRLAGTGDLAG